MFNNVSTLLRCSTTPPSGACNIRSEMNISLDTSISACNHFKDILMCIVKTDFGETQLKTLKISFESFGSYLFPSANSNDERGLNNVSIGSIPLIDKCLSRLQIITLDCCYEFAENLQPKLQTQAASLFPAQILAIIKARNKEKKGKGENKFVNSTTNVKHQVMTMLCVGSNQGQLNYGDISIDDDDDDDGVKRIKYHH